MSDEFIDDERYETFLTCYALDGAEVIEETDSDAVIRYTFKLKGEEEIKEPIVVCRRLERFHSSEFTERDIGGVLNLDSKFVPPDEIKKCLDKLREEMPQVTAKYALFGNETNFDCVTFGNGTNFGGATFGNGTYFGDATFDDETYFGGATFGNGADFDGATLGNKTHFGRATFGNKTHFGRATFGNGTNFRDATFGNETDFRDATFGNETDFGRATFDNGTNFRDATFDNGTNFRDATFDNGTNFRDATFGNETDFGRATFDNGTNFRDATFGNGTSFGHATFGNETDFRDATFGNGTSFGRASFGNWTYFGDATFGNETYFGDATFGNETYFRGATFGNETDFRDATFGNRTFFWDATFGNETYFWDATFGKETDFGRATFGKETDFGRATFGNGTDFRDATFGNGTDFRDATFGDETYFEDATFGDETYFFNAEFSGRVTFRVLLPERTTSENPDSISNISREPIFDKAFMDFSDSEFFRRSEITAEGGILLMRGAVVRDVLTIFDFEKIDLSGTVILERLNISWNKLYDERNERKILRKNRESSLIDIVSYSADLIKRENQDLDEKYKNKIQKVLGRHVLEGRKVYESDSAEAVEVKKKTLQELKENYRRIGEYNSEDRAFVEYMRTKAAEPKSSGTEKEPTIGRLERWGFKTLDLFGEYGTNIFRIFAFLIIIPFIMSLLILIAIFTTDTSFLALLGESLRSSFEAFLTFGINTAETDNGWLHTLCIIDGYLGLFFVAYFVVAVARRTLR